MSNILVTGAGGFIGFHLCNYFAKKGFNVTGIDLHFPKNINNEFPFKMVVGDFRDKELMEENIKGQEFIYHLAAAHLQINFSKKKYWEVNVHSLEPFLGLARKNGIKRFIFISSTSVYGNLKSLPANEESPVNPLSIYGDTKAAGEQIVKNFSKETGFRFVILRPVWVYGRGCPRTLKLYKALIHKKFVMIGNGENLRHPVYINDLLEAFHLAIVKEEALGKVFIIGGEKAITINELINSFIKIFSIPGPMIRIPHSIGKIIAAVTEKAFWLIKKEPPISKRSLEFFNTNNSFDTSNAQKVLSFIPKYSFEEGLENCKEWLEKNA